MADFKSDARLQTGTPNPIGLQTLTADVKSATELEIQASNLSSKLSWTSNPFLRRQIWALNPCGLKIHPGFKLGLQTLRRHQTCYVDLKSTQENWTSNPIFFFLHWPLTNSDV